MFLYFHTIGSMIFTVFKLFIILLYTNLYFFFSAKTEAGTMAPCFYGMKGQECLDVSRFLLSRWALRKKHVMDVFYQYKE